MESFGTHLTSMFRIFLSILGLNAIAFGAGSPAAFAQFSPRANPHSNQDDTLKMIMVDQSRLNANQRQAFQHFLQTANLPRTKVGQQCRYYGKPQVWCLLLDPPIAEKIFQQLKPQPFGSAADIKTVHRFRGAEKS